MSKSADARLEGTADRSISLTRRSFLSVAAGASAACALGWWPTTGFAKAPAALTHYLKFYQMRYGDNAGQLRPAAAKFSIGRGIHGTPWYTYAFPDILYLDWVVSRDYITPDGYCADDINTGLTDDELDEAFDGEPVVTWDRVQIPDILQIHESLSDEPLDVGTVMDAEGNVAPTNSLADYQQGRTITIPVQLAPGQVCLNFNTSAVRRYAADFMLLRMARTKTSSLFVDGPGVDPDMLSSGEQTLHYISPGTAAQQIVLLASQKAAVFRDVHARGDHPKILHNAIGHSADADAMLDVLLQKPNIRAFDGFMSENEFWQTGLADVQQYWELGSQLLAAGKKLLFLVGCYDPYGDINRSDSRFIGQLWLWLHLVAQPNTYVALGPDYSTSVNYDVYSRPLGAPRGAPVFDGRVWRRAYAAGTIKFDPSVGLRGLTLG